MIVIDDYRDTADTFAEYMGMLNVNVLGIGHDGKRAVELYEEHRPDMVFLNLMMPEYDGVYALQKIRQANPKAKIIMITADLKKDAAQRLEELKPDRIIFKPFDYDKIIDAVDEIRKTGFG